LPIGLQIAAKPFDEATLLRAAHAYERRHDWKDSMPPLDAPSRAASA
jgi:aspartyl-tRNA(Asn)/glutamyl-tRNA(Gln) amidotransferase subunit A